MSESAPRRSVTKRIVFVLAGFLAFALVWVVAVRLAVMNIFKGIETQKATGLSAVVPFSPYSADSDKLTTWGSIWISRSASLQLRTDSFDRSVDELHSVVATHHGYLEDLRTESRSGNGRTLFASVSVPSADFDPALADLKALGRVEVVSEAGEDSGVKLASAKRRLAATQTNLARLQKLQLERKGELRDAVALEKDIAQGSEAAAEAERQRDDLVSTVAQAHIRVALIEDYRASMEANWGGATLQLRNSVVEGVSAILSSLSTVLDVLLEFGLPSVFWLTVLFFPSRAIWGRFRRSPAAVAEAQ